MKRAFTVFLLTTIMGLAAVGWVVHTAFKYGDKPSGTARGRVEVEIPKGASAGQVAGPIG